MIYFYTHDGKADWNTDPQEVAKWHEDWKTAKTVKDRNGVTIEQPIDEEVFEQTYHSTVELVRNVVIVGRTSEQEESEQTQARITQIKIALDEIDRKSIRPERAIASGTGTDADTEYLKKMEAEATTLREELKTLQS
jgi:hypothetical protein